jgi:type I restriction enzyme S subunit
MRIAPDVEAKYTRTRIRADDVLITVVGSVGQVAVVPKELAGWNVARAVALLRPRERQFARWIASCLRAPTTQHALGMAANTTVQTTINLKDLRKLELPIPPAAERQAIQGVLSALDDRIDLLRQTNATLESIAQALFKSWFIDFDPVRAKAEGREPEGMDAATAALFPAEFEESVLGVIPKGWTAGILGNICELTKGCSYKGDGLSADEGAYMFNLGCFNAQRVFATEKVKRYTGEYRPRHAVKSGDLIIANTDMTQARDILGRPAIVPSGFDPGFVSHHVFKVTVNTFEGHSVDALRRFLFFTFREPAFRERAIGFATGTTVLALPATAVLDCPACIPEALALAAWNEVVRPLFSAIRENEARAENLAELRDSLLPRLISGKLRLPEAQERLEDALA